jgi:hypothetical protein
MGIADERRLAELRYKQSRNRALFRAIGYTASLIPAILVAMNFEAFRSYVLGAFGGVPIETVQQSRVATPSKQPQPRIVRRTEPPPRQYIPRVSHATPRKPITPPMAPRQPVQLLPAQDELARKQTESDYVVTLDLSERLQRFSIEPLTPDQGLRIRTTFAGVTQVTSDAPARINLNGPYNPRIEVSVEVRGKTILVLEYAVDSERGKPIALTPSNLGSIRRRIMRRGGRAAATLGNLEAEKIHTEAYLASSQAKLWTEKRDAEMRIKKLPALIEAARVPVAQLQAELSTVDELIQLVEQISGKEIEVYVDGQST